MERYQDGDKVFLFGFSRGAYTVRALAGVLYKCGLLQKGSNNLISYASKIYNKRDNKDIASGFKKTYCHECKPYFIGVWDTVGSMGWFWGKKFFDTKLNNDVTYGYHAVAIDEKRKKFPVSLWDENRKTDISDNSVFPASIAHVQRFYARPRWVGGQISWRWN